MIASPFQIRRAKPHEVREAVALSIASPSYSRAEWAAQVEAFLAHARAMSLDLSRQWLIAAGQRLVTGCTSLISPGGMAALLMPADIEKSAGRKLASEMIQMAALDARASGCALMQYLVDPGESTKAEGLLKSNGFSHLARLEFMEAKTLPSVARPSARTVEALEWASYNESNHSKFIAAMEKSYIDSLDCPRLTDLRTAADAIQGHRAAGYFRPERWLLLCKEKEPIGCILLVEAPLRGFLEVAYMGLAPEARSHGFGQCLVFKAIELARVGGFAGVSLAVDSLNVPARRLYQRCGFIRTIEKDAWLRVHTDADKR